VLVTVGGFVDDKVLVDVIGIGVLLMVGITSKSSGISVAGEQAHKVSIRNTQKMNNSR
jgi:UPF0716 family protein affecting phage T7 exclusion